MSNNNQAAPWRLKLAQTVCNTFPPVFAYLLRNRIFSVEMGQKDNRNYVIRTHTGKQVVVNDSDYAGYLFCTQGYGEWRNWLIGLCLCDPGDTIIEVGAQFGLETVDFAAAVGAEGKVHTFEPLPQNVSKLTASIEANGIQNIVVHPRAVGDQLSKVRFAIPPQSHTGIGYVISEAETSNAPSTETFEVDCVTLDSMMNQFDRVKLICIDVEGFEIPVIKGAKALIERHKPAIIVEAERDNQLRAGYSIQKLCDTLREFDYDVYAIDRFGLSPANPERRKNWNWVAIHSKSDAPLETRRRIGRYIRFSGMMPRIAGLNLLDNPRKID